MKNYIACCAVAILSYALLFALSGSVVAKDQNGSRAQVISDDRLGQVRIVIDGIDVITVSASGMTVNGKIKYASPESNTSGSTEVRP